MKILFRLYGLSRVAFFSLYFSALMCVMDALDFNWISAFPTDFTCFYNLLPAYPRSLENTGIYARKPSLMLSLVLCHFTKVPVVHKGKRKGTNRPVGGTACPVDMRLARTETECRLHTNAYGKCRFATAFGAQSPCKLPSRMRNKEIEVRLRTLF